MIIKETKYLTFESEQIHGRKTKIIHVVNKSFGNIIATIEWYGAWRQYCFFPSLDYDTVWNNTCLTDVIAVIDLLMKDRQKPEKPQGE